MFPLWNSLQLIKESLIIRSLTNNKLLTQRDCIRNPFLALKGYPYPPVQIQSLKIFVKKNLRNFFDYSNGHKILKKPQRKTRYSSRAVVKIQAQSQVPLKGPGISEENHAVCGPRDFLIFYIAQKSCTKAVVKKTQK